MNGLKLIGVVSLLFLITSCKKEIIEKKVVITADKVTRIPLSQGYFAAIYDNDTAQLFSSTIVDFNKSDYEEVDSVKFVIVECSIFNDNNKPSQISLYDLTNSKIIQNSTIIFESPSYYANGYSKNIKDNLPDQPISLGIKTNGVKGSFLGSYVYIYR